MKTALVCGAGGFVGGHLVRRLKSEGYWVRGVDLKYPEFSKSEADDFRLYDLRDPILVAKSLIPVPESSNDWRPFDEVYQLAADMGGAGFVFTGENDADIMHNSALINLNVLDELAYLEFKGKVFYSSSACMYPQEIQNDYHNEGLRESDAYPANPDSEYGWEKLFSERLYFAFARNKGLDVRVARFHNIYGPEGTYEGGREKAPAAMCRKVVEIVDILKRWKSVTEENNFKLNSSIEVWGTGHQTRSFLYIDDCIDAVRLFMQSDFQGPLNIGSEEMVTINQLAQMAIDISGKDIKIKNIDGPVGVMGRNSNNDLIREKLKWEPKTSLKEGLEKTYRWIKEQMGQS